MNVWQSFLTLALLFTLLALIFHTLERKRNWNDEWRWIAAWLAAVCWLLFAATGSYHAMWTHDQRVCTNYGIDTDRTVKFVKYSMVEWDCLVLTDDGWVSKDNVYSDLRG